MAPISSLTDSDVSGKGASPGSASHASTSSSSIGSSSRGSVSGEVSSTMGVSWTKTAVETGTGSGGGGAPARFSAVTTRSRPSTCEPKARDRTWNTARSEYVRPIRPPVSMTTNWMFSMRQSSLLMGA